jgi:uncharacterized LabA/DUF88 family protein
VKTYCFIDASNLFYGGLKSLGWSIDYKKFKKYLEQKYKVKKIYYFGGIETYDFKSNNFIDINELYKYYLIKIKKYTGDKKDFLLLMKNFKKLKFYRKLNQFGYILKLKKIKTFTYDGKIKKKANCDVDMTFFMMYEKKNFDRVIALSGDGDFLIILEYLKSESKEVLIMSRNNRTAKEIRRFAGHNFLDFQKLRNSIEMD